MADSDRKPEPPEGDPAKLAQLLEIELIQKRAEWRQAKARRGSLRTLSFLFLFLVIVVALVGFFIFLSSDKLAELRSQNPATPSPAAPTARP
jgi:hypothetical protein